MKFDVRDGHEGPVAKEHLSQGTGGPSSLGRRLGRLTYDNRRVLIVAVCAIVFVALLEDVLEGGLMHLDAAAYRLIVEGARSSWLTPIMEGFSALATPVVLVTLLLAIAAFAPGRRPGLCCALNLVLVAGLNVVLKLIVQRPRPEGFRLAEVGGFSFPSGHSMAAMAFFGLLVWLVWHYERDRGKRWFLCAALSLVAVMVGVSRVYLGVHYASDVVAGFCVALAWLAVYTHIAVPLFLGRDRGADDARGRRADAAPGVGEQDEAGGGPALDDVSVATSPRGVR